MPPPSPSSFCMLQLINTRKSFVGETQTLNGFSSFSTVLVVHKMYIPSVCSCPSSDEETHRHVLIIKPPPSPKGVLPVVSIFVLDDEVIHNTSERNSRQTMDTRLCLLHYARRRLRTRRGRKGEKNNDNNKVRFITICALGPVGTSGSVTPTGLGTSSQRPPQPDPELLCATEAPNNV